MAQNELRIVSMLNTICLTILHENMRHTNIKENLRLQYNYFLQ